MDLDWSLLPPKALRTIFSYFSQDELFQILCVCKNWYRQIQFSIIDAEMDEGDMEQGVDAVKDVPESKDAAGDVETDIIEIDDDSQEAVQKETEAEDLPLSASDDPPPEAEEPLLEEDEGSSIVEEIGDDEADSTNGDAALQEEDEELEADTNNEADPTTIKQKTRQLSSSPRFSYREDKIIADLAKEIPDKEWNTPEIQNLIHIGTGVKKRARRKPKHVRDKIFKSNKENRDRLRYLVTKNKKRALIRLGLLEDPSLKEQLACGVDSTAVDITKIKQEKEDVVSSGKVP